jgi:hypothetical protein
MATADQTAERPSIEAVLRTLLTVDDGGSLHLDGIAAGHYHVRSDAPTNHCIASISLA